MDFLNRFSIKTRLLASISVLLICLVSFAVYSVFSMLRLALLTETLYDHPLVVSNAAYQAKVGVIRVHSLVKDMAYETDDAKRKIINVNITKQEKLILEGLELVKSNILGKEGQQLVKETTDLFLNWKSHWAKFHNLNIEATSQETLSGFIAECEGYLIHLENQTKGLNSYARNKADSFIEDARNLKQHIVLSTILIIIGVIILILGIVGTQLFSITSNINKLTEVMTRIKTTGELIKAKIDGNHEIADLSIHFNNLIENLKNQLWIRNGINKLNDQLAGKNTYSEIMNLSVTFISRHINACSGAIFSFQQDEQICRLEASFAYVERNYLSNRFELGEGIVGQVALEKKPILLKNIKSDDFEAVSGTMSQTPLNIYTIPLIHEQNLVGVLEVASFEIIDAIQQEVLEAFANIVSIFAFSSAQNERVQDLYNQTQQANVELNRKTQALNQTNERLTALNDELQAQSGELQAQTDELEHQKKELNRQRIQVEKADRLKSEFLSNMSHELRTPLNSILALSQLMISAGTGKNPQQDNDYLVVIERNGKRLLSLINDILDLSKIEAGKLELIITEFSVDQIAQNLKDTIQPLVDLNKIDIIIDCDPDMTMVSDKEQVHKILLNLLSNSVKFTYEGHIKLSVQPPREDWIVMKVEDTGIGIDPDDLSHIFDDFRQIDGSLSRQHDGTGLGLSICQKLASNLGGKITVESEPDKGSCFSLYLPVKPSTKPSRKSDSRILPGKSKAQTIKPPVSTNFQPINQKKKQTILVIDDDTKFRQYLKTKLTQSGYHVYCATNGKEGLRIARKEHPSLITLDILMPEMDGFEFLKTQKKDETIADIPVIIVSMTDENSTGAILGASSFVTKPIDFNLLLDDIMANLTDQNPARLLIVDDDPAICAQLAEFFSRQNLDVETASDGNEALSMISKNRPSVIILDLLMPKLDGQSLLKKIRAKPSLADIPVIVFTAKDLAVKEQKELSAIVHKVLFKGKTDRFDLLKQVEDLILQISNTKINHMADPLILLVEDNDIAGLQINRVLQELGYRFRWAQNGVEALNMLKAITPDALILDLMMPEMDGFQLLNEMRANPETHELPVLILTAKELTAADRQTLHHNHVQELIQKGSVDREQLAASINKLIYPHQEPESFKPVPEKPDKKPKEEMKILVVEDNEDNLITIGAILNSLYFAHTTATDGEIGFKMIKEESPDLVLLDIQLPKLSGIDVLKRIKSDSSISEIPVIALTAKAMKGDKESLIQAGFDDYISKPIDPDEVRETLKKWLR